MSTPNIRGVTRRLFPPGVLETYANSPIQLTPGRITLGYILLGIAALYVSDVEFVRHLSEPFLSRMQALKGGVEVVLTGAFIYLLTSRREQQLAERRTAIESQRRELKVLHRVFRHNLRNDLNIIQGYVDILCANDTEQAEGIACKTIDETLARVERYTTNAERINRITSQNGTTVNFDLSSCLPEVCAPFEESDEVEIQYRIPPDTPVVAANPRFPDCIEELVTNAIQYTNVDPVRIRITVEQEPAPSEMVEIRIEDNGPGVPDVEKQALQEGEEGDLLHLSGMGLWYVSWTMQHSDGTLELEENANGGTTAVLRVLTGPAPV